MAAGSVGQPVHGERSQQLCGNPLESPTLGFAELTEHPVQRRGAGGQHAPRGPMAVSREYEGNSASVGSRPSLDVAVGHQPVHESHRAGRSEANDPAEVIHRSPREKPV